MRLNVCKIVTFDAAHSLPGYKGACARLHGHQWVLEIEVSGIVDETGMVVDFVILKKMINDLIVEKFDHHHINDFMAMPTAENMVCMISGVLNSIRIPGNDTRLERVRLFETPTSFCEWRRG
jgi:6-pyruvoyltetrahydropterin/6-carboxytetrahydropterin synthase